MMVTLDKEFERFYETNAVLMANSVEMDSNSKIDGVILVDLWHNNVQYFLRSIIVAKYLQRVRPARLIGLTGQPGVVTRSCGKLDLSFIYRLSHSFGIDNIISIGLVAAADFSYADDLLQDLEPFDDLVSPTLLRERLNSLMLPDGYPIGRFIYDTTLRSELRPTVERVDVRLRYWAAECLRMYRWAEELVQANPSMPLAFITGHLDYNPWGMTGEVVRRRGGEVFWFRLEANVPVVRIAEAPGTLNAEYHRIEADWFKAQIWPLRHELTPLVQELRSKGVSRALHRRWTAVDTPSPPVVAVKAAAAVLRSSYGWTQTDVVIGIFAHALSDQPLADLQLYADRYQWLLETLTIAARHSERRWIVKLHPRDAEYDATGSTGELIRQFGRLSHIRFISAPVATGLMESLCDCAVTLFGAPGLAFAVAGRPVIVAGNGPYADCGFVHKASDQAHYKTLLLADPLTLKPSPEEIERAQLYTYVARVVGAPSSPRLDPIMTVATEEYWKLTEARLRHHLPECDDLQEAIRQMMQTGERRLTNPILERFLQTSRAVPDIIPASLPLLESDPLYFRTGGKGVPGLLKGFAAPETIGVWATEASCVIAFRLGAPPVDGSVKICLNVLSFGSDPDWPRRNISIFAQHSRIALFNKVADNETLEFDVPFNAILEDGTIVLSLLIDDLRSPALVGVNEDMRLLGIGLTHLHLRYSNI